MKNSIYLFLFIFSPLYAQQSGKSILDKVKTQYSSNKFIQFNAVYNLYKNHEAKTIYQSYKGEYFKNPNNEVYLKINSTEYYLNSKISIQINHDEKLILATSPGKIKKDEFDIAELLKWFNISNCKDKKTYWEVELLAKQGSSLPYGRVLLNIGKDFYIQKQLFYYSNTIDFSNDYSKPDHRAPKLEIIYSKYNNAAVTTEKFDFSKYFKLKDNMIKLSTKYNNYQVVDKR